MACANVANLLLGRIEHRHAELATRTSLGAARTRLLRQLLTEALALAGVSALLGAALAVAATRAIAALGPPEIARLSEVRTDLVAFSACALVAMVSALLFGFIPAWRGSAPGRIRRGLASHAGRISFVRGRGRGLLLTGELAVALVLLRRRVSPCAASPSCYRSISDSSRRASWPPP
jgi:hypothetical protein